MLAGYGSGARHMAGHRKHRRTQQRGGGNTHDQTRQHEAHEIGVNIPRNGVWCFDLHGVLLWCWLRVYLSRQIGHRAGRQRMNCGKVRAGDLASARVAVDRVYSPPWDAR